MATRQRLSGSDIPSLRVMVRCHNAARIMSTPSRRTPSSSGDPDPGNATEPTLAVSPEGLDAAGVPLQPTRRGVDAGSGADEHAAARAPTAPLIESGRPRCSGPTFA